MCMLMLWQQADNKESPKFIFFTMISSLGSILCCVNYDNAIDRVIH
jgi:hypothetical protein